MKLPPALAEKVAPTESTIKAERDRSFLFFAAIVLVAIALGFKSELLGPGQVWAIALGLVVIASPALLGYLRGTLTVMFGAGFIIAARLDYLRLRDAEKRGHLVLQEAILILVLAGAYLVVVTLPFNPILRLLWIFTITFLASYRSFRINGIAIPPRRAFIFALFVGQVVTFLAWAITALSLYLVVSEGWFAAMLLIAWYINRGLVRHTVEDSFTRNVVLEYGAFAIILIYLFVSSYQPSR